MLQGRSKTYRFAAMARTKHGQSQIVDLKYQPGLACDDPMTTSPYVGSEMVVLPSALFQGY